MRRWSWNAPFHRTELPLRRRCFSVVRFNKNFRATLHRADNFFSPPDDLIALIASKENRRSYDCGIFILDNFSMINIFKFVGYKDISFYFSHWIDTFNVSIMIEINDDNYRIFFSFNYRTFLFPMFR